MKDEITNIIWHLPKDVSALQRLVMVYLLAKSNKHLQTWVHLTKASHQLNIPKVDLIQYLEELRRKGLVKFKGEKEGSEGFILGFEMK